MIPTFFTFSFSLLVNLVYRLAFLSHMIVPSLAYFLRQTLQMPKSLTYDFDLPHNLHLL